MLNPLTTTAPNADRIDSSKLLLVLTCCLMQLATHRIVRRGQRNVTRRSSRACCTSVWGLRTRRTDSGRRSAIGVWNDRPPARTAWGVIGPPTGRPNRTRVLARRHDWAATWTQERLGGICDECWQTPGQSTWRAGLL